MPKILAPAKINLRLKITGRRPDGPASPKHGGGGPSPRRSGFGHAGGYHLIDSVMVKLDLYDEIQFEWAKNGTVIEIEGQKLPADKTNTLWKTADLVRKESGKNFGIQIHLKKKIPSGAGLGGGSSDAASLLITLNQELGLDWPQQKLIDIGVKVGADVPFFLVKGPQKVQGIGEILTPYSYQPLPILLVNPGIHVSTKEAYRWWDEGGLTGPSPDAIPRLLENDLEKVVFPRYPVLAEIKQKLISAGALGALMSGSGSTLFGLFDSTASRDQGYKRLLENKDPVWWIWKGKLLGGEDSNLD